ncbi:MAG: aspartate kinase [candidate division WOR-3 bacterium]|nr:aspartate kinase [candidate division WOR-3 bacterium]
MEIIVQKFGGSVIKDLAAIEKVAEIVVEHKTRNQTVVVVVSAMGDTTDKLLNLARKINPYPEGREIDMLLTSGERITMALLSLALWRRGVEAISFTGSQVGIITDAQHTDARIIEIKGNRLYEALKQNKIPIIAGFQGVSFNKEITTLGRGGSDVTAVAIAAFLKAKRCELYKDVLGVFTENPKLFPSVKHISQLSYQEMSELTTAGAEILHPRACALALKYKVPLVIKSLRRDYATMINSNNLIQKNTEKAFVRAISHNTNLCRLSLVAVPQLPKCLHQVIVRLAEAKIPLLFFAHGVPYHKKFDLSFIVTRENYQRAKAVLETAKNLVQAEKLVEAQNLASISLIGPGIGSDVEIFSELFETLHKLKIHTDAFTSSEMKITCFLHNTQVKKAVRALLKRFDLVTKNK